MPPYSSCCDDRLAMNTEVLKAKLGRVKLQIVFAHPQLTTRPLLPLKGSCNTELLKLSLSSVL